MSNEHQSGEPAALQLNDGLGATGGDPTDIHSAFNACMYQRHCKRMESLAVLMGAGIPERCKKAADLDGNTGLFGWKFDGLQVTVFMEDDGEWHPKFSMHRDWLLDLQRAAATARGA